MSDTMINVISNFHNEKEFLELFGNINNSNNLIALNSDGYIFLLNLKYLNNNNINYIQCPLEIEESLFKFIRIIQHQLKQFMEPVQNGYQIIDYLMNYLERNITEFWISSNEIIGYSFFKNICDNNRYNNDIKIISYEGNDLKIKIYENNKDNEDNEERLTLQELNILFEYNPERKVYCF
jgi:hypothetical protein